MVDVRQIAEGVWWSAEADAENAARRERHFRQRFARWRRDVEQDFPEAFACVVRPGEPEETLLPALSTLETALAEHYQKSVQQETHKHALRIEGYDKARSARLAARTVTFNSPEERRHYVLRRRREGATLAKVGQEIGVGPERVRGIQLKAERLEAQKERRARTMAALTRRCITLRFAQEAPLSTNQWDEVWTAERQWMEEAAPAR